MSNSDIQGMVIAAVGRWGEIGSCCSKDTKFQLYSINSRDVMYNNEFNLMLLLYT